MRNLFRRTMLRSGTTVTPALRGVAVSGMVIVLAAAHNPARPGLVPGPAIGPPPLPRRSRTAPGRPRPSGRSSCRTCW